MMGVQAGRQAGRHKSTAGAVHSHSVCLEREGLFIKLHTARPDGIVVSIS
jgi:hypothetical protein